MTMLSAPAAELLAAAEDQLPEDVGKSGPLGLLVTVLLLIAVVLLVRSMTRHLKRVPPSFDEPTVQVPDTPAELVEPPPARPGPDQNPLDDLRRAPRAIEPPRPNGDADPDGERER